MGAIGGVGQDVRQFIDLAHEFLNRFPGRVGADGAIGGLEEDAQGKVGSLAGTAECPPGGETRADADSLKGELELLAQLIQSKIQQLAASIEAGQTAADGGGEEGAAAPVGGGGKARGGGKKKRAGGAKGGSNGGVQKASGGKIDGPNGFLWKPQSDSDGKLAILTPSNLTGKIAGVSVKDPSGNTIAKGRPSGVGNGDREHFRFNKPGGAFPPGSIVEIQLKDGTTKRIEIPNPGQRYD